MDDSGGITYVATGATMGLVSYYVFGSPGWLAILVGVFGPLILALVVLIVALWYWVKVGD